MLLWCTSIAIQVAIAYFLSHKVSSASQESSWIRLPTHEKPSDGWVVVEQLKLYEPSSSENLKVNYVKIDAPRKEPQKKSAGKPLRKPAKTTTEDSSKATQKFTQIGFGDPQSSASTVMPTENSPTHAEEYSISTGPKESSTAPVAAHETTEKLRSAPLLVKTFYQSKAKLEKPLRRPIDKSLGLFKRRVADELAPVSSSPADGRVRGKKGEGDGPKIPDFCTPGAKDGKGRQKLKTC